MRLMGSGPGRTHARAHGGAHRAALDDDGSLRLALGPGDERLPWLEGEEEDEEPELDRARILAVGIALLLLLAVLGGLAWWFWAGRGEAELAADGSTIEAPDGPYKVRPRDPGGREVAGTGAESFRLAEGLRAEGRIAPAPSPAQPAAGATGAAAVSGEAAAGIGVQIGAYPTREAAQAGWSQLSQRLEPLQGRGHRILEGTADSGTIYRLQVMAESLPAARQLCGMLREAGGDCQVKR